MTARNRNDKRLVIYHLGGVPRPIWLSLPLLFATIAFVGYSVYEYQSLPQLDLFPYIFGNVMLAIVTVICGTSFRCIVDPETRVFTRITSFVGCTVCAWQFSVKEDDVLFLLQHKDYDDPSPLARN